MSPVSLFPILPIVIIALITMRLFSRIVVIKPAEGRYQSIDGLRGYLAFFVFIHHSLVWYFFLRINQWVIPPSQIYDHLGPTSVALFFMITAFLFFSKLMEGKVDWLRLYVSRIFRILPLYLFVITIVFIIIGFLSGWNLRVPPENLAIDCMKWLFFIQSNINGIPGTKILVAGVIWSLAFEWLFYCSLPFWGLLLFKIRPGGYTILIAGITFMIFVWIIYAFYSYGAIRRLSPFLGGMVAAYITKNEQITRALRSPIVSLLIILALLVVVIFYPTFYYWVPYICLSFAFIAIASGNTLFGILSHPLSRVFGQISYSIYLLHGLLLFVSFQFILKPAFMASLSPLAHWGIIAVCGVVLVILSSITYKFIEKPCIDVVSGITRKINDYFKD